MFTHFDPDHVEGITVVEQIALDFRIWAVYAAKQIELLLPKELEIRMRRIGLHYGSVLDFYEWSGFVRLHPFDEEEYWNRSYDVCRAIECTNKQLRFAYDGMRVFV